MVNWPHHYGTPQAAINEWFMTFSRKITRTDHCMIETSNVAPIVENPKKIIFVTDTTKENLNPRYVSHSS